MKIGNQVFWQTPVLRTGTGYYGLWSGYRRTAFGTLRIPVWGTLPFGLHFKGMSLLYIVKDPIYRPLEKLKTFSPF